MLTLVGMYVPGEESLREALMPTPRRWVCARRSRWRSTTSGWRSSASGGSTTPSATRGRRLRDYIERGDLRLAGASHLYLAMILVELRRLEDAERHVRQSIAMLSPTAPMYAEAMATLASRLPRRASVSTRRSARPARPTPPSTAWASRRTPRLSSSACTPKLSTVAGQHTAGSGQPSVKARTRLLERAAKIHDPEVRRHFLEAEHESRATLLPGRRLGVRSRRLVTGSHNPSTYCDESPAGRWDTWRPTRRRASLTPSVTAVVFFPGLPLLLGGYS